jgi:hypothetical protein
MIMNLRRDVIDVSLLLTDQNNGTRRDGKSQNSLIVLARSSRSSFMYGACGLQGTLKTLSRFGIECGDKIR